MEKLTDWDNPPKVADLKQDYTSAQADHEQHSTQVRTWLDNLNATGSAKVKTGKHNSSVVPKVIRKQAEWRYASLSEPFLSTPNLMDTKPKTFEDSKAATQNGLVLNNQFNTKMDKVKLIDDYIRTAVDEGTVVFRTGWKYLETVEEQEVIDYEFIPNPAMAETYQQLQQLEQSNPNEFSDLPEELRIAYQTSVDRGFPLEAVAVGSHTEDVTVVKANHPIVEICEYDLITIDPTAKGDMAKAKFVIKEFETSLSELKAAGIYENLDDIPLDGNNAVSNSEAEYDTFQFKDEPRKRITAFEYWGYWDIHDTGITEPILATWVGDVLIRMEANPFPDGELPFVLVQYLPVRNKNFGEPDGALIEDNQKIIGATVRGMIDIMAKSANSQEASSKDALDATNRRRKDAGESYYYNQGVDPRQAFYMHTYPEIPRSAETMLQLQHSDAESLTGVKSFSNGISGASLGNVAAGVRGALDAASKRELAILRRLADGLVKVARKITAMNALWLSEEEVIRITNTEFVTVKRDDLAGDIDIAITISTAEKNNNQAEELAFMLQTTGQTMGAAFSQLILSEIASLRDMPSLAKSIAEYKPEPDPIAQETAQLQVELLKAQIANEYAKAKENTANGTLDDAKALTEQAKARNYDADTDNKDLEFVEKETGTTHVRDLEQTEQQAKSNTEMKMVEHDLNERSKNNDTIRNAK